MKTQWSGIGMVAGSGKVQGTVMFKGRNGAVARVRVKPVNGRTQAQIQQRSRFSTRTTAFRGLTQAQIAAWNAAADSGNWAKKDRLGISFNPTGSQLYNELNLNLTKIGASNITEPPVKESLAGIALTGLTVSYTGPDLTSVVLEFSGTLSANDYLTIRASTGVSPGRTKWGTWTTIGGFQSTSPLDFTVEYQEVLGLPPLGSKVFCTADVTSDITGQSQTCGVISAIVT